MILSVVLLTALAVPESAHGDRVTDIPELQPTLSLSKRVTKNLTLMGDELGQHLSALSFELVDMRFDLEKRTARLKLGVGEGDHLAFRLDGDIFFRSGYARIKARVDLRIIGQEISFELPEFDMVPRTVSGRRAVELRVPLLERRF